MEKRLKSYCKIGILVLGLGLIASESSQSSTTTVPEPVKLDPQKTYILICEDVYLRSAKRSQQWNVQAGTIVEKVKAVYTADLEKEPWVVATTTQPKHTSLRRSGVYDLKNGTEYYQFTGDQKIPVCSEEKK